MVAAEAAAAGCPPLVARHSGPRRGRSRARGGVSAGAPPPGRVRLRRRRRPRRSGCASCSRSPPPIARRSAPPRAPRSSSAGAGRASRAACSSRSPERPRGSAQAAIESAASTTLFRSMGDEQRVPTDQLLRDARERFEEATDFTVAVEEEFALLDPVSLDLVNRFEDVQAAAAGGDAERYPRRRADRVRDRDQDGQGRDASPTCRGRSPSAATSSSALVEPLGLALGATGAHPWANWKDQRIIDTPHYRRNDELLRYVVLEEQHLRLPRPRRDPWRRPRAPGDDGAPQLAARAARALGELAVRRGRRHGPSLGADADLHPLLPALRRPGRVPFLGGLRALRPLPLRHGLDHGAHAALVERAAAPRVPDGRDPDLRRPARPRRVAVARGAVRGADGAHRPRDRRGRADRATSRTA